MQTKKQSFVEAITNTFVGLAIATITNRLVLPLFGYDITIGKSLLMAMIFTIISVVRNYLIRRCFNDKNM